jgi:type IV pilus assembly protein PilV
MKKNMSIQIPHKARTFQHGVGLVEVLVAMLLLSIGVLGYEALQVRAVEASSEALTRSQAMILLRGLAENIRVMDNPTDQNAYVSRVHGYAGLTGSTAVPMSCVTATCSAAQMADYNAYQTAYAAYRQGIKIDMYVCPTTNRQCLVAAWGNTTPTVGSATTDCMTPTGSYQPASTCIMLEAY